MVSLENNKLFILNYIVTNLVEYALKNRDISIT